MTEYNKYEYELLYRTHVIIVWLRGLKGLNEKSWGILMVTWEWEKHLSCIFKHNLPLTCCLVYSYCRRSILTFRRAKSYKSARHCKNSHFALCSGVASNILQSHKICRKQLFVQSSGIKGLAFHAITATLICTAQTGFYPASAAWTVVCCVLDSAGGF